MLKNVRQLAHDQNQITECSHLLASYSNAGATADGIAGTCVGNTRNVWFKFQATTNKAEIILQTLPPHFEFNRTGASSSFSALIGDVFQHFVEIIHSREYNVGPSAVFIKTYREVSSVYPSFSRIKHEFVAN